jgi:peptidylprolyl isomerase
MAEVKNGDTVKIHYTGRLNDGVIFDTSLEKDPLEFKLGSGAVIPGFESAVMGMTVGDKKTTTIPMDEAYGPYDSKLVAVIKKENVPETIKPELGQMLRINQEDGGYIVVRVTDVNDADITLDGNHPLAGKDLTFDIELVEIII